jgi:hypothetical protein
MVQCIQRVIFRLIIEGEEFKREYAMMKKGLLVLTMLGLTANFAYTQSQRSEAARQVQAGEVVPFGDNLFVKVSKSTKQFAGVKVKGEAVVVVLDMDAGKSGATLFYNLTADPATTELFLLSGTKKLAPRAVIEDFPSWGKDNDQEVDTLDPKETIGGVTLNFQQKGSIALLFDVPPEDAKTPKKLSVALRMVLPKDERRSFVVTL